MNGKVKHRVKDIMTPVVCEIQHDKLVCEVEGIMVTENISGAPLVNPLGEVVGLISKSDIVHFDFIGGDTYTTPALEICTTQMISVSPTDSVHHAAKKIIQKDIHRLLVIDDNKMVGIVSAIDIVKWVSEQDVY